MGEANCLANLKHQSESPQLKSAHPLKAAMPLLSASEANSLQLIMDVIMADVDVHGRKLYKR